MSRLNKAEDLIRLAMLFQNSYRGLSIEDIAEEFEVERRSAERMKAVLFNLFPEKIEEVPTNSRKKRWRFAKGTMNSLISFDANDFANLEYLKNLSTDTNRKVEIQELIEKIKALTPQKNMSSLNNDISTILESEGYAVRQYAKPNADPKILEDLRYAMMSLKKIKFIYKKDGDEFEMITNPYGIVILDRYYIVGFYEKRQALRTYRLDRIKSLTVLDEYFEKDENFDLQKYCNNSFGIYQEEPKHVVLEFDKSVADDVLNYYFHPTQEMKKLKNGNVKVTFTASGTHTICQELFKWKTTVKILEPTELLEIYKEYLKIVYDSMCGKKVEKFL